MASTILDITPLPIARAGDRTYALLMLPDPGTVPETQEGFAIIYVDPTSGDLCVKFGDGTIKTIVIDT